MWVFMYGMFKLGNVSMLGMLGGRGWMDCRGWVLVK